MFTTLLNVFYSAMEKLGDLGSWLTTPTTLYFFNISSLVTMFDAETGKYVRPSSGVWLSMNVAPVYIIGAGLVVVIGIMLLVKLLKNIWDALPWL